MTEAKLLKDKFIDLDQQMAAIRAEKKKLIDDTIAACPHDLRDIAEAPYRSGVLFSDRPERVCLQCGLSEEGWGCGHKLLAPGVYSGLAAIDRDRLRKVSTKYVWQNGDITYYVG